MVHVKVSGDLAAPLARGGLGVVPAPVVAALPAPVVAANAAGHSLVPAARMVTELVPSLEELAIDALASSLWAAVREKQHARLCMLLFSRAGCLNAV